MSRFDLRSWLTDVEELGELQTLSGADTTLEIGSASQVNYRRAHPRVLLFDNLINHPSGYRVVTGSVSNPHLFGLALAMRSDLGDLELVEQLRGKTAHWLESATNFRAVDVPNGPVLENVVEACDVNLLEFPSPLWHEQDGGRYIGTGCAVVTSDPETGSTNVGAYRVQVQDNGKSATINIEAGKHGMQHLRRWFQKEGRAPVAVSLGHHPVLLIVAGTEVPAGVSEFDYAGAILGEPLPVIRAIDTGLPVPAESELAFEGWMYPDRKSQEGPFGEWTGYYSGGAAPVLNVEITHLYHRDDPIVLGAPPGKPPHDYSYMRSVMKSAMAMDALVTAGVAGVSGVWTHEVGGGRLFVVVAIEQRFPGHSRQVGYLAAQLPVTGYMNRFVVIVDSDVNPRDLNDVMWAVSTRCDPDRDIEIMPYSWGSRVDPLRHPSGLTYNNRALIDACRPYETLQEFPAIADTRIELLEQVTRRWPELRT